jgi:hypothetical protein
MTRKKNNKPSIDKVYTNEFKVFLNLCGMDIPLDVADKIIDIIELMEIHGSETNLEHIVKLQIEWEKNDELHRGISL